MGLLFERAPTLGLLLYVSVYMICVKHVWKSSEVRTDGRTNGQTDRQTDERTHERTDGQTDRRTDGRTDRHLNVKVGGINFFPTLMPQWRTFCHVPQFDVHLYNKWATLWRTNPTLWRTNVRHLWHLTYIFVIFSLSHPFHNPFSSMLYVDITNI